MIVPLRLAIEAYSTHKVIQTRWTNQEFHLSTPERVDLGVLLEEWPLALIYEVRTTNRKPLLLTEAVYFAVDFFLSNKSKYPVFP